MDFTLKAYNNFLHSFIAAGYTFVTFHDYLNSINSPEEFSQSKPPTQNPESCYPAHKRQSPETQPRTINHQPSTNNHQPTTNNDPRTIILRHDVDLKPQNSLATAKIEHELGIKGSYYFRMVPESYDVGIIKEIARLGHEIGYHYETMDTTSSLFKVHCLKFKDKDEERDVIINGAYEEFCKNLEHFRTLCPVKTICMHGSPRSKFDNRDIWKKFDYKKLGLIGEPYFDIDFNKVFYLTDTGRRWDGHRVSVRDKLPQQHAWNSQGLKFATTKQIIKALQHNRLPDQIMVTVHPQRWTSSFLLWITELVMQTLKNHIKRVIVSRRK